MLPAEAVGFAVAQYGLISTAQMHECGISDDSIGWFSETKQILGYRRGVWRLPGTPDLPEQPVMAALLAAGAGSYAGGWTAAALLNFPKSGLTKDVMLTAARRIRLEGVRYLRPPTVLLERDLAIRRNIATTDAARTICDGVRVADASLVQPWVDHSLRRHLATAEVLDETCRRFEEVGARKIEVVRSAISRIVPGQEKTDNDFEVEALRAIVAAKLPLPVVQFSVTIRGRVFTVDLAWPSRRLGVELKGFDPHGRRGAFDYDNNVRENAFRSIRWTVYTYTTAASFDLMIADLSRHLSVSTTPPAAYY